MVKQEINSLLQIPKCLLNYSKKVAPFIPLAITLIGCNFQDVGNVAGKAGESLFILAVAVLLFLCTEYSVGWG